MSMTESELNKELERVILKEKKNNELARKALKQLELIETDCRKVADELQQYKAIGTVSEFRELKEKATPKKIGHCVFYREMGYGTPWQCLTCGADQIKAEFSCEDGIEPEEKHTFCWMCGQKLDWSERKEQP